MGAWGHGPFDNDSAQDWLAELIAKGPARLSSAIHTVAHAAPDAPLEFDACAVALAAAELIAAARDGRTAWLDEPSTQWLAEHRAAVLAIDAARARGAVERVANRSELREHWDDAGKQGAAFHGYVRELIERLTRASVPSP